MGDFNSIRSEQKKVGCLYNKRDMDLFNGFIDDLHLLEIVGDLYYTCLALKIGKAN